jgi:hypothetical protein
MTAIPPTFRTTSVSIDSRFAEHYYNGTADFMIRLPSTMRNVSRIELTSAEVPLVAYVFSSTIGNTTFRVDISGVSVSYALLDGNYTVCELLTNFNSLASGLELGYDPVRNLMSIVNNSGSPLVLTLSPSLNRYSGLGYWLGFRVPTYVLNVGAVIFATAAPLISPPAYALIQLRCPDMMENTLHLTDNRSFVPALAKIVLNQGSSAYIFDNAANYLLKENVFARPTALTQMRFTLVDPYGKLLQMGDMDWSLTLEVTEIINPSGTC